MNLCNDPVEGLVEDLVCGNKPGGVWKILVWSSIYVGRMLERFGKEVRK